MDKTYNLVPADVKTIQTAYRKIQTKIPVPESIGFFETLLKSEPRSMQGQPPVLIDSAEGFLVRDKWGNQWIDWSSGVLIMNAGHGRPEIRSALMELIERPLLSSYVFAHEKRCELTRELESVSPDPENYKVFLLSTGSEAIENSIKLAKTYAQNTYGAKRKWIISFNNAFHGRTLGSQLAGGSESQKKWIGDCSAYPFAQVPFPDGYKNTDQSFDLFLRSLDKLEIKPDEIAAVLTESYQGVGPDFLPYEYAQDLQRFVWQNGILLIFDEVQAGFGRTGSFWGYEQYDIVPDLIVCGKGISSSLPLSAVIGRADIMDMYPPGSMTSTHSGSPLPVTAALESIKIIKKEKLSERAKRLEPVLMNGLEEVRKRYPERLGCLHGRGLVAGIQVVQKGSKVPDPDTAFRINEKCFQNGLLMFAPVGIAGECIKITPPLIISDDALIESIQVFSDVCDEVLGAG